MTQKRPVSDSGVFVICVMGGILFPLVLLAIGIEFGALVWWYFVSTIVAFLIGEIFTTVFDKGSSRAKREIWIVVTLVIFFVWVPVVAGLATKFSDEYANVFNKFDLVRHRRRSALCRPDVELLAKRQTRLEPPPSFQRY